MSRKRWMIVAGGVAAVAILVAVGFGVQAYASANAASAAALTTATSGYCAQYESALAGKLNTSTSALEQANQAAAQAVLDQMVKDGKITSAQETQIVSRLKANNYQLCPGFGGPRGHGDAGGPMAGVLTATVRATLEKDVAGKLGISTTTLQSDLANGQTLAQIASAQKVTLRTVESVYLSDVQNALKSDTSLTSTQATAIYNHIKSAADSGRYILLERPHGPHGGMGGMGGSGAQGNPPANTSAPASN